MRNIILMLLVFFSSFIQAQEKYQLSSHILDISQGKPAPNVKISLSKQDKNQNWVVIDEKYTDNNGRIKEFLKEESGKNNNGVYTLTFHIVPYFERLKQKTFYPFIEVIFEIKDTQHYHIPITLSPYGYSTYRGN